MLVGLYVSAYENSSPCTDFHGIFLYRSVLKFIEFQYLFKWNNN